MILRILLKQSQQRRRPLMFASACSFTSHASLLLRLVTRRHCRHCRRRALKRRLHHRPLKDQQQSFLSTTTTTTSSSVADAIQDNNDQQVSSSSLPLLDNRLLYQYLKLETFSNEEISEIFNEIVSMSEKDDETSKKDNNRIGLDELSNYLLHVRFNEMMEKDQQQQQQTMTTTNNNNDPFVASQKVAFANQEAKRVLESLLLTADEMDEIKTTTTSLSISKQQFTKVLQQKASTVEWSKGVLPISISMLLVGSSVGIITPVMPFLVQELNITPTQYGLVVSSFAVAKMFGNIPSAILVERHGRKPYMTYSLALIGAGVGMMGIATSWHHLVICRLCIGSGVAALSTAATLSMADLSTSKSRASTMAPIMSAFAAGTALGPALGGMLADTVGIHTLFYAVGSGYMGLTLLNNVLLKETKSKPIKFPWNDIQQEQQHTNNTTIKDSANDVLNQWKYIMISRPNVRSVVIMNGFYWVGLSGGQMTLLPLLLTDPTVGLEMSATQVGQVYMGMSLVQVFGNPLLAKHVVDKIGKSKSILFGCTILSTTMALFPYAANITTNSGNHDLEWFALPIVFMGWACGSTILSTAPVAYISDHTSDSERAQAIALLRTSGDVGCLTGAAIAGALVDHVLSGDLPMALQTSAGILFSATTWFGIRKYYYNDNNRGQQ